MDVIIIVTASIFNALRKKLEIAGDCMYYFVIDISRNHE